jgi:hypothetical protein
MRNTITVEWPALPIGEPGWRTRLESLAERSEALIGKDCSLHKTAGLALELLGLMWPVLGAAETVAATCRASLLLGAPGVLMATAPADQVQEIAARLDAIWQQAQNDPAAGMVELPPPLLSEIKPVPYELAAAVEPPAVIEALVEPAAAEASKVGHVQHLEGVADTASAPAADPDELPEAWRSDDFVQTCQEQDRTFPAGFEPPEPIEPAVVWLRSDDLAAALGVSRTTALVMARKGLFDGLSRKPRPGEGWGRRFDLEQCRAAYEARPGPRRSKAPAPAPLPVTIEPLPPAVEPSAPEPTPEAAADAAALLELAGGDEATLAALRALLLVPVG